MQKLDFGTAGIRGILGEGESFLNIQHVYRVVEGYAKYLLKTFPDAKKRGVVIGRDSRYESKNFAEASAAVLDKYNIKVHFSKDICATPFVSYSIKKMNAVGGINITASHNPKNFNGIKVYNFYGAQILPEEVDSITKEFLPYEHYLNKTFKFSTKKNVTYIPKKYFDNYIEEILKIGENVKSCSNIKVAFSPLNGTGAKPGVEIFKKLKVKYYLAENQMRNNSHFTHCKSLNPESSLAFEEVKKVGLAKKADLLLITDPDSDRIGLGVWDEKKNDYLLLNGNETATLIFQYLLDINKTKDLSNHYMIYSFVSTTLPKIMAEKANVKTFPINTGFKWVSEVINKQDASQKMLFAFEESYGSLIDNSISYDKDAFQSLVILCKMASFYKKQNINFIDLINKVYKKYGYVISEAVSIDLDPSNPNQLNDLKNIFVKTDFGLEIKEILDYNKGVGDILPNDMIKIEFVNDSWISLRPSGTEPKIKFYIFSISKTKKLAIKTFEDIKKKILDLI